MGGWTHVNRRRAHGRRLSVSTVAAFFCRAAFALRLVAAISPHIDEPRLSHIFPLTHMATAAEPRTKDQAPGTDDQGPRTNGHRHSSSAVGLCYFRRALHPPSKMGLQFAPKKEETTQDTPIRTQPGKS